MIHDTFRPRFLGQVRLSQGPAPAPSPTEEDLLKPEFWSTPIHESMRPKEIGPECKFVGYRKEVSLTNKEANLQVSSNETFAKRAGYSDLKYTAVPPCSPTGELINGMDSSVLINPNCVISQNSVPQKMVWACPGSPIIQPPPTGPSSKYDQQPLPLAPASAKPDLVPVAAGAGVVAILAAIIGGAFGGK